jgi:hypothetical protein
VYRAPQTVVPAPARINPIPQTYYRTTYRQIPVTVYRPITGTDVVTGYPLTINRPCTTNEWQVQRVPTGVFGMGHHPGLHSSMSAPMATTAAPGCGGCNTTMPATSPYYTPPAGGMAVPPTTPMTPGTGLPPATTPPTTPMTTPGSSAPPTMTPGSGVEPAEQRPSLSYTPSTANGTQYRPAAPPANAAQPASSAPTTQTPMAPIPPRAGNLQLRPVPDPDAPAQKPAAGDEPPQLLNPRDRMAAAPSNKDWGYAAINWPTNQAGNRRPASSNSTATTRNADWDASGWKTVPAK